jgi:hypothetical protein
MWAAEDFIAFPGKCQHLGKMLLVHQVGTLNIHHELCRGVCVSGKMINFCGDTFHNFSTCEWWIWRRWFWMYLFVFLETHNFTICTCVILFLIWFWPIVLVPQDSIFNFPAVLHESGEGSVPFSFHESKCSPQMNTELQVHRLLSVMIDECMYYHHFFSTVCTCVHILVLLCNRQSKIPVWCVSHGDKIDKVWTGSPQLWRGCDKGRRRRVCSVTSRSCHGL